MNSNRMPQIDSIEELVRFWQVHDLTDFEEELEEVDEPVFRREAMSSCDCRRVKPTPSSKSLHREESNRPT